MIPHTCLLRLNSIKGTLLEFTSIISNSAPPSSSRGMSFSPPTNKTVARCHFGRCTNEVDSRISTSSPSLICSRHFAVRVHSGTGGDSYKYRRETMVMIVDMGNRTGDDPKARASKDTTHLAPTSTPSRQIRVPFGTPSKVMHSH